MFAAANPTQRDCSARSCQAKRLQSRDAFERPRTGIQRQTHSAPAQRDRLRGGHALQHAGAPAAPARSRPPGWAMCRLVAGPRELCGSGPRPRRHGRPGRAASRPGSRRTPGAGTFPRKRHAGWRRSGKPALCSCTRGVRGCCGAARVPAPRRSDPRDASRGRCARRGSRYQRGGSGDHMPGLCSKSAGRSPRVSG
jgi:hypothetical protein